MDIVAFAVCFDNLHIDRVYVPGISEGTGTIRCQHGIIPVPVPAVLNITSAYNIELSNTNIKGELVTPTGADCSGCKNRYSTSTAFYNKEDWIWCRQERV